MFRLDRFIKHIGSSFAKETLWWMLPLACMGLAWVLSYPLGIQFQLLPVLLSIALLWFARQGVAWQATAGFVQALYGLQTTAQAGKFLGCQLYGRSGFSPYLIVKEGKVAFGDDVVRKIGGPGGLVVYHDSAVVLEQGGRLTRVIRGPAFPQIGPFEKVWDVIDLRPQRWVFAVSGVTHDGIPIDYDVDIEFQVGETDDDVFKAATDKWIRDASRTEPDRLMIWTRRVIIGRMEGSARAILARYTMDQLIDSDCRKAVRDQLETDLAKSAQAAGVKILHVALGDLKLRGQVVQQWIETWRAEREREMNRTIGLGRAERAGALVRARAKVRQDMLDKISATSQAGTADQAVSSKLVILDFIRLLKHTSFEQRLYLPGDMVETMNKLQQRIEKDTSAG